MDKIVIRWEIESGEWKNYYEQEVVTAELASYATGKAIEAVKRALVAEDEAEK